MTEQKDIHPVFDQLVQLEEREQHNGHRGAVLWLTGLSGSGKSTIAAAVERELFSRKWHARVLDGDNVRAGLNRDLSFTMDDRRENTRRVAEVAKLFAQSGTLTLCSFVSPTRDIRAFAKTTVGADIFHEIYVSANLETCETRDVKGLYAKARAGEIRGFTGIDSPYEPPLQPALVLDTDRDSPIESAKQLIDYISARLLITTSRP